MDTPSNLDFSLFYKAFRRFVGILPWNTCFKIMKKGSKTAISSKGYPHSTDKATKTAKSPVSMWKSNCKKLQLLPFAYSKAELLPYICPIDSRFISKFFLSHVRGNPCIYHSTDSIHLRSNIFPFFFKFRIFNCSFKSSLNSLIYFPSFLKNSFLT